MNINNGSIPEFIKNPNLPSGRVTDVIISESFCKVFKSFFAAENIKPNCIKPLKNFDGALASHTDLACCHLGENRVVLADLQANREVVSSLCLDAVQAEFEVKSHYPEDISLNLAVFGNFAVHNFRYTDPKIVEKIADKTKICVKQGYSKCSILPIDEKSAITDDAAIAEKLIKAGVEVLLIEKGKIALEGYNYGFIGGSGFKPDCKTVAFTGKLDSHPSSEKILSFIKSKNLSVKYMTDAPIFDVGSIIPIKESCRGVDTSDF